MEENPILEWYICGSLIRPLVGRTLSWQWYITCSLPLGIRCNALFQDSGSSSRPYLSSQTITSSVSLGHGCTAKIKERTDAIRQKKLPSGMNENACCCSCFWNDTFICLSTRAPQRIRLPKDRYTGLFRALLPKGLKIGLKRKRIASKRLPSQIYPLQALFKLAFNWWTSYNMACLFLFFADHKYLYYYYYPSVMNRICGARS